MRDDADADLNKADFNLAQAEAILDAALLKVAAIREKFIIAEKDLKQAQWEW